MCIISHCVNHECRIKKDIKRVKMFVDVKLEVYCIFIILCCHKWTTAERNVKTWRPNNNIFNKENWIDPDVQYDCGRVEFGAINTADIFIEKLTAKEFVLPVSGDLILLDGGYLEIVNSNSKKKTDCLKLKEISWHHYINPENWASDVADNPAVPDNEKIPCLYDKIKFPNGIYSGVYTAGVSATQTVSALEFGNDTFDRIDFDAFKSSDVGSAVFDDFDFMGNHLAISERKCFDPTGCSCNRGNSIQCPLKRTIECLSPVEPIGFCHKICGAYTTFKPEAGFYLARLAVALKDYTDVRTHVSKVDEDHIQVVFAEDKYTGDSVIYAEKFYETLKTKSKQYRISNVSILRKSGSQTTGDSSLWTVLLASLFFVIGLYGVIFYMYGDHNMRFNIRFNSTPTLPLSSSYRARFSPREDESGLIFDNQSLAGSVMNLDQSFDNPMYGQVSTAPDITDERNVIYEPAPAKIENTQSENSLTDPLSDLNRLNQELKEEIGKELVQDFSKIIHATTLPDPIPPLIEVDESNENIYRN